MFIGPNEYCAGVIDFADTGVHKVLPSRGKPGLPRATGPRMLCRSAEACDSYECVRIVAIIHMASKLLLLPTV